MEKAQLVTNLDILRHIVSRRVQLDITDRGRCPFHDDATASFGIFTAKSGRARYNCFGCGEKGDVIDFVRKITECGFNDALQQIGRVVADPSVALLGTRAFERPEAANGPHFLGGGFCEKDCVKYAAFREDYNYALEENYNLKDALYQIYDLAIDDPEEIRRIIESHVKI